MKGISVKGATALHCQTLLKVCTDNFSRGRANVFD